VNIKQTLRKYTSTGKISPLDAEILLSYVIRKPKEYLFAHPEKELTETQETKIKKMMSRRYDGEPIAYLTNSREFYGLDFYVDKNVLIPRPETEILVEKILNQTQDAKCKIKNTNIFDIGTGTGNIIISIAKNIPDKISRKFSFHGIDISKKALQVARKNARKNKVDRKIEFTKSDLLEYLIKNKKTIENKNLIITANLPYVSPKLYDKYFQNLKFEPRTALVSDDNGLRHYKDLLKQIKESLLIDHCLLTIVLEISPEQKKPISRLILRIFPDAKIDFYKDLAGKIRIAEISCIRN
jgi:release factor glutamine methyltransferase